MPVKEPKKLEFKTYSEFWPYYLAQHAETTTRRIHVLGLVTGTAVFVFALAKGPWPLIFAAPVVTYGILWPSHYIIEKNKPATLIHPFWSLISEFRMVTLLLLRRL